MAVLPASCSITPLKVSAAVPGAMDCSSVVSASLICCGSKTRPTTEIIAMTAGNMASTK